tara:strand:- start:81 stop:839 length:759 start_codon:yes stop_codon:yes gene_type:complete
MELIKGNCLEKLKDIPDKSVDLAYMDLCYGQTACKWDKKFTKDEWVIFWKELKRVARNDRTPFFFSCTTKFGYDIIESNKKWFRWDLVWKKNRAAGFLNAYKIPMRKHEMIYCFSKKCPEYDVSTHSEYKEDNKECNHQTDLYGKKEFIAKSKRHNIRLPTSDITPPPIDIDEELSTWCEFKNDERTGHRTAKPVSLMKFLLKYWSKEGSTVLDPTMGSGSMGIACKKMNRKFIGIELNDDIYELAKKRIGI